MAPKIPTLRKLIDAEKHGAALTILRLPAVKHRTGLSRSSIYLGVCEGTFPKPVRLGVRAVGWLESEVQQWLEMRVKASRTAAA